MSKTLTALLVSAAFVAPSVALATHKTGHAPSSPNAQYGQCVAASNQAVPEEGQTKKEAKQEAREACVKNKDLPPEDDDGDDSGNG